MRQLTLTALTLLACAAPAAAAHPGVTPLAAGFPLPASVALPFAVLLGVVVAALSPRRDDR